MKFCFEQIMENDERNTGDSWICRGSNRFTENHSEDCYKQGMIRDEEQWLRALQARNNVTHSYNQKIALGIIADAKEEFYQMFCELKQR